ncbi:glycoside hydrolase family 18 protein, partial [Dothistroma septosporum NZE10]
MLPLVQNPTQLTHLYLASLHINSDPKAITLNDNNPNDTIWNTVWSETAQIQAKGVKVLMSIGGAAAGSYPRLCSGTNGGINETYYIPLYQTLKYHKVDGVNLDIEEQVKITCPYALLQRLNKDFGTNFLLTMAPVASELQASGYGLGGFSYKTLDRYATNSSRPNGKLVNWYNVQFYNGWGDASTPNGYQSIIQNGYAASRVSLGVLDNPGDGGSGWFNVTTYQATIKSLRATYGSSFGGVVGWEYWDAGAKDNLTQPYQWAAPI